MSERSERTIDTAERSERTIHTAERSLVTAPSVSEVSA
jgi:hypothetical protein